MRLSALFLLFVLLAVSTVVDAQELPYKNYPTTAFADSPHPGAPDYNNPDHWAALPEKADFSDDVPKKLKAGSNTAAADVFFIHPTTYTGRSKHQSGWNASLNDEATNKQTDESTIKYQASAFNQAGQVFAPRYRQAHLHSFYAVSEGDEVSDGTLALNLAYEDVKAAFQYYLENHNNGRPFMIASHSQGAFHGARLIKELIDGKEIQDQMIAAYLVGMPIEKESFENIEPCETPDDTNCFCSWRTFAKDYYPPWYKGDESHILVTNPLTWTIDDTYADYALNKGGVLKKFNKVRKRLIDAQVHQGILWVNRPKMFGARLVKMNNYHVGDINLYYVNVRENAALRSQTFTADQEEGVSSN